LPAAPLTEDVLTAAMSLAGRIAVRNGQGPEVLSTLTGRTPLTAGFSVV